jgi:hypothetical protein
MVKVYVSDEKKAFFVFDEEDVVPKGFKLLATTPGVLEAMMVVSPLFLMEVGMDYDDKESSDFIRDSLVNMEKIGLHVSGFFMAEAMKKALAKCGTEAK